MCRFNPAKELVQTSGVIYIFIQEKRATRSKLFKRIHRVAQRNLRSFERSCKVSEAARSVVTCFPRRYSKSPRTVFQFPVTHRPYIFTGRLFLGRSWLAKPILRPGRMRRGASPMRLDWRLTLA